MANGIGRKRTLGIAKESTFGTAPGSATYVLPLLEWQPGEKVEYVENEAASGSIYKINDAHVVAKYAEPSFKFKVDEDALPLLLLNFGTVTTTTVASETVIYQHVFAFTTSNQKASYSIYIDDPDRTDAIFSGFRVSNLKIMFNKKGYVECEISGVSQFPDYTSVTNTLSADWKEFYGRVAEFKIADEGGSLAAFSLLEADLEFDFGVSVDDDSFNLNSTDYDLDQTFNKEAEFSENVTALFPDLTYKNKWAAGTKQAYSANIKDSRILTGSTTSQTPTMLFTHPSAYISEWAEEGGLGDVLKQTMKLKALDKIGIADTPIKITVINTVASY